MKIEVTDELLYQCAAKADRELFDEIPDQPDLPFTPSVAFEKRMKKLMRQSRHPKRRWNAMSAGRRVAVVAIVVFAIGAVLSAGVKAAIEFRMRVVERRQHEEYLEERYSVEGEGGESLKVFTYVPSGYTLKDEEYVEDSYSGEFENQAGQRIIFLQARVKDHSTTVRDSEFEESHTVNVNGMEVLIGITKEGWRECFWLERDIWNSLYAQDLSEEELVKMIRSMENREHNESKEGEVLPVR